MKENDISYILRGEIFKVYNTLGPGTDLNSDSVNVYDYLNACN